MRVGHGKCLDPSADVRELPECPFMAGRTPGADIRLGRNRVVIRRNSRRVRMSTPDEGGAPFQPNCIALDTILRVT